jgi:hypothetical protein
MKDNCKKVLCRIIQKKATEVTDNALVSNSNIIARNLTVTNSISGIALPPTNLKALNVLSNLTVQGGLKCDSIGTDVWPIRKRTEAIPRIESDNLFYVLNNDNEAVTLQYDKQNWHAINNYIPDEDQNEKGDQPKISVWKAGEDSPENIQERKLYIEVNNYWSRNPATNFFWICDASGTSIPASLMSATSDDMVISERTVLTQVIDPAAGNDVTNDVFTLNNDINYSWQWEHDGSDLNISQYGGPGYYSYERYIRVEYGTSVNTYAWSALPIGPITDIPSETDVTLTLIDTFGDGWNGGKILVTGIPDNGIVSGSESTDTGNTYPATWTSASPGGTGTHFEVTTADMLVEENTVYSFSVAQGITYDPQTLIIGNDDPDWVNNYSFPLKVNAYIRSLAWCGSLTMEDSAGSTVASSSGSCKIYRNSSLPTGVVYELRHYSAQIEDIDDIAAIGTLIDGIVDADRDTNDDIDCSIITTVGKYGTSILNEEIPMFVFLPKSVDPGRMITVKAIHGSTQPIFICTPNFVVGDQIIYNDKIYNVRLPEIEDDLEEEEE